MVPGLDPNNIQSNAYQIAYKCLGGNGLVYILAGSKKNIWQCRLNVRGIKGYVRETCNTNDLAEAFSFASQRYDELKQRVRDGLTLKSKTFKDFFERDWLPYAKRALSSARYRVHEGTGRRYLLPFFGQMSLENIKEPEIASFWDWRRDYYINGLGADDIPANAKINPSIKTLQIEKGVLNQALKYAKRSGFIPYLPLVEVIKDNRDAAPNRRPNFNRQEWKTLYQFMEEWQNGGIHDLHRFQRQMLRNFVCFLMNSGLRPKEALSLRWKDLGKTENGHLKISIPEDMKTGSRTTIPNIPAMRYLYYVRQLSNHTNPNDLIFADKNGTAMDQSHKTFKKMLIGLGLLKDGSGKSRTFYSCRHSYITFRLMEGVPVEDIARNAGTSVKQIQMHYDHISNEMKAESLVRQTTTNYEDNWHFSARKFYEKLSIAVVDGKVDEVQTEIEETENRLGESAWNGLGIEDFKEPKKTKLRPTTKNDRN